MSSPMDEEVRTNETGDVSQSFIGHGPGDVNITSSSLSTPVMSEEVPRHIKTATGPLAKQLQ